MRARHRMRVFKEDGEWVALNTRGAAEVRRKFDTHAEALAYAFRVRDYWFR